MEGDRTCRQRGGLAKSNTEVSVSEMDGGTGRGVVVGEP